MESRLVGLLLAAIAAVGVGCSSSTPEGLPPLVTPTSAAPTTTDSAEPVDSAEPGGGAPNDDSARTTELANGLDVVVTPLADAPTVAVALVFDIGSHHDPAGRSGLAHFAEHILITAATSQEPARTVEAVVGAYPNGWNAQTGSDFTILATVVEPSGLAAELERTAARLAGVEVTAADVERERERILVEVDNMFGGIPPLAVANLAREQIAPTPNGGRRGGDPEVLASLTVDEVRAWLEHYRPGIATLSVAGPVDAGTVLAAVEEAFGSIPAGGSAPPLSDAGVGGAGLARRAADGGDQRLVTLAYRAPSPEEPAYPAFLVGVGRLFIEQQSAGFSVVFAPIDDPSALTVTSDMAPGESADDAAARLRSELVDVLIEPLRDGEGDQKAQLFGLLLGFDLGEQAGANLNPYGVAFSAARRPALGIDPSTLELDLAALDDATYQGHVAALIVDAAVVGAAIG